MAVFVELGLLGTLAGLGAGLLDGAFVLRGHTGDSPVGALSYALAVDMIGGLALGLLAAVPIALSRCSGNKAWTRALPAAAVGMAVLFSLNTTLFDGGQISQHPQLGLIKAGFYTGVVIASLVASMLFPVLLRQGAVVRIGLAAVCVAAAAGGTYAGLNYLNAYPTIKTQFALFTWAALVAALALARAAAQPRPRQGVVLTLVLTAVAFGSAGLARADQGIRGNRSLIIDSPFPATLQIIPPVEDVLKPLFPLPEIKLPSGPALEVVGAQTGELQSELNALVPGRRRMHVLWIAIDALRRDHVGCYGYERATTPRIDAFAKECVRFLRTTTPTPASALAYSSTLTGLFGRVSPAYDVQHRTGRPMPDHAPIANLLRDAGRRSLGLTAFTGGTMRNPIFKSLTRGFDEFSRSHRKGTLTAPELTDRALEMIDDGLVHERPLFCWLHYLDPHGPYEFIPEHRFGASQVDAYDSEIAYTDAHVGRLFDELKERGLYDDTIIVLFADHGEAFGEHNNWKHGASLYSHQIDVPLMIRVPGLEPREVEQWVGLSDLVPTTLALLGLPDDMERLGRDLTPLMLGHTDGWVDSTYSERPDSPRKGIRSKERCVISGNLKLIWKPHHQTYQVFDLEADPGESRNLFDPERPDHQRLLAMLDGWDRRIAGFSGTAPTTTQRTTMTLSQRFKAAVDALVAAETPEDRKQALEAVGAITELPSISRLPANRVLLDEAALATLKKTLIELLPGIENRALERGIAIELLIFMDDPDLVPLFTREMKRPTHRRVLGELAIFRARHGDQSVLPLLLAAYEKASTDQRVTIGAALARLGDDRGRAVLRATLSVPYGRLLVAAIRGLAALNDPWPAYFFLFSHERHWSHEHQYAAMLEAATTDPSPLGTAALVRISAGGAPHVAQAAREELRKRLTPAQYERVPDVGKAFAAAHYARGYRRYELVTKSFASLTEADDALVGPGWLMLAESEWEAGLDAERRRGVERLEAIASSHPTLERAVSRIKRYGGGAPRPATRDLKLVARLVGDPVIPSLRRRSFFYATVEVTNESGAFVSGGWSPEGPQLAWDVGAPGTGPAIAVPLSPEGLEPGESTTIVVVGQWPKSKGECTPELVTVKRPKAKPTARLLKLETRSVE